MDIRDRSVAKARAALLGSLLLGLVAGGALVAVWGAPLHRAPVPVIVPRVSSSDTLPSPRPEAPARQPMTETLQITAREREVLARLARLPDLPVIQAPAFDIKGPDPAPRAVAAKSETAMQRAPVAAQSVIARIQIVSVEKERVFYRSIDDQLHTARAGERLLGVNGRVVAIDEHGAELQIDGQRMRVASDNL